MGALWCCPSRDTSAEQSHRILPDSHPLQPIEVPSESQLSLGVDKVAQQGGDAFEATSRQSDSQSLLGKNVTAQQDEDEFEATGRQSESQPHLGADGATLKEEDEFEVTSRQSEPQPPLGKDAATQQGENDLEVASRLSGLPLGKDAAFQQKEDEFEVTSKQSDSQSPLGQDATAQQEEDDSEATSKQSEVLSMKGNRYQSPKPAMSMRCKLALQKSHKALVRELDVGKTLDHLFSEMILFQEDIQRINGMSTDYDKRRTLLRLLPERGQGAYDALCGSLSADQPWLKDLLDENHGNITQDELVQLEQRQLQSPELTDSLRRNMQDRLVKWKTALEEGVSDQEGILPYIKQPCLVETDDSKQQSVPSNRRHTKQSLSLDTDSSKQESVLNTIGLVENSHPGDRLVIYGEAGMGKTTLLKQLARSWIEGENKKLLDKFTYVFLIPLRRVGQGALLNIICDELGLVPVSSLEDLKKSLGLCEHRVLFLLDSFEELRGDVVRSKRTDIDDLITGKLFPKSTVVVTSRPGSKLKNLEDQTTAHLQDLPENEVKLIIQHHFGEDEYAVDKVQRSFPAMAYLQKPINLALFIFIITQNKHLTLSYTQAELFSLVLQYIMLAFAKKKDLEEFIPQSGSYIANEDIHGEIRRLFSVIAKTCYEERKEINVKIQVKGSRDLKDFLDFGLFTAGPDTNTVLLPHRLFIEYFAAAHLAEHPTVWNALFKKIKAKSERKSPRPLLADVVRAMGLENILRFVIALSPQPQVGQVCRQVGSLFVVERKKIDDCDNYQLANFEYYSELMRDSSDESGKRLLAAALLDAPVRNVTDTDRREEDRSHVLLSHLNYKQRVTFLKKVHNIALNVEDGKSTILACTGDKKRLGIADRFVLALVYHYDCIIKADKLYIKGERLRQLDLPASVLTRMSGVRQLSLDCCTLCEGLPNYMPDIDRSASATCLTNNSQKRVELWRVKGLEHCDVITSRQCQLEMRECGDVRVSALKTCFPRVSELELGRETTAVYETEEELTSWLQTVQTVRRLRLAPQHHEGIEGESMSMCHLLVLNILSEKKLEYLRLERSTLLLDTSDTIKQNNTLSGLELRDCKGDVDLCQLLEVCSRQFPQLKKVWVYNSNLVFDDHDEKVESDKQLPGLQKFTLLGSAVDTQAGRTLSEQEAERLLQTLCPSAGIYVSDYGWRRYYTAGDETGHRLSTLV